MTNRYIKDPQAHLDYQVNWTAWLGTDTISASTWIVPAGITLEAETETLVTATVWLSGGTEGESYTITNRIVTAGGRTDERSLTVFIVPR